MNIRSLRLLKLFGFRPTSPTASVTQPLSYWVKCLWWRVRDRKAPVREPQLHSHITDVLDEKHPLAYEMVWCESCKVMVHARNNECMQTWVETGAGNFCLSCFARVGGIVLRHDLAL